MRHLVQVYLCGCWHTKATFATHTLAAQYLDAERPHTDFRLRTKRVR